MATILMFHYEIYGRPLKRTVVPVLSSKWMLFFRNILSEKKIDCDVVGSETAKDRIRKLQILRVGQLYRA